MIKFLVVAVTSLTILFFVLGCPPEQAEPAQSRAPALPQPEVIIVETDIIEPNLPTEPNVIEPDTTEPNIAEPNMVEPNVSEPSTIQRFYKGYAEFLEDYVDDTGMVDYRTLRRKRLELKNISRELETLDPNEYKSWNKEDKIAFWINIYNLQMLEIIIDNYPIESNRVFRLWWPPSSIRHIPPMGDVGASKWNAHKFIVMEEEFTILEIERRFFRKQFDEPRAFLALSLASKGSPPLRNEPYCGNLLYKQLDDQAKKFLATPQGLKIDKNNERVYLSAVFEAAWPWYGDEFLKKYHTDKKFKSHPPDVRAALNFITNYTSEKETVFLETGNYSVKFKAYDWRLNE